MSSYAPGPQNQLLTQRVSFKPRDGSEGDANHRIQGSSVTEVTEQHVSHQSKVLSAVVALPVLKAYKLSLLLNCDLSPTLSALILLIMYNKASFKERWDFILQEDFKVITDYD